MFLPGCAAHSISAVEFLTWCSPVREAILISKMQRQRWHLLNQISVSRLVHTLKAFSSSGVFCLLMRPTELQSGYRAKVHKYQTSTNEKIMMERVVINLVCCLRCPVNSFIDVSFIQRSTMKCFLGRRGITVVIPRKANGQNWKWSWAASLETFKKWFPSPITVDRTRFKGLLMYLLTSLTPPVRRP